MISFTTGVLGGQEQDPGEEDLRPIPQEQLVDESRGGVTVAPNTIRAGEGMLVTAGAATLAGARTRGRD